MRRFFYLLPLLIGSLTIRPVGPVIVVPLSTEGAVKIRTWFDVKQGVTHVGFSQPVILDRTAPPIHTVSRMLDAEFVTRGYKTDPPDVVTLTTDSGSPELKLFDGDRLLGRYRPSLAAKASGNDKYKEIFVPRSIFQQWSSSDRPVLQSAPGDNRIVDGENLKALRELSRRMVARRALTFYFGRESLTATTLNDGRVLVVGGYDGFRALKNCEMYDPTTGRFATGLKMQFPRRNHTATLLKDGRVLIVGGGIDGGDTALDSAELFDPATNQFSPAGKMHDPRMSHTATLLNDGRVLIAGGGGNTPLASVEIYDLAKNSFIPTGNLVHRRLGHTATMLPDGNVLIAGGVDGEALGTTELYASKHELFTEGKYLSCGRYDHTSTVLPDGTVFVAGGNDGTGSAVSGSERRAADTSRIYPPAKLEAISPLHEKNYLSAITSLEIYKPIPRWGHIAVSLGDGRVLLAGGYGGNDTEGLQTNGTAGDLFGITSYNPGNYTFIELSTTLLIPRRHLAAATLKDGRVLLIGGLNDENPALNTAEFYDPKTDEISPWRDIVNGEK